MEELDKIASSSDRHPAVIKGQEDLAGVKSVQIKRNFKKNSEEEYVVTQSTRTEMIYESAEQAKEAYMNIHDAKEEADFEDSEKDMDKIDDEVEKDSIEDTTKDVSKPVVPEAPAKAFFNFGMNKQADLLSYLKTEAALKDKMPHLVRLWNTIKHQEGVNPSLSNMSPEEAISIANKADPTNNIANNAAKYTQWLLKQLASGQLTAENADEVRNMLSLYNTEVRNHRMRGVDLNTVSLEELKKSFSGNFGMEDKPSTNLGPKLKEAEQTGGAKFLLSGRSGDSTFEVVEVSDPEAAAILFSDTAWCVKNSSTAENYLENGNFYCFYKNGEPYVLLHHDDLRDVHDHMINEDDSEVRKDLVSFATSPVVFEKLCHTQIMPLLINKNVVSLDDDPQKYSIYIKAMPDDVMANAISSAPYDSAYKDKPTTIELVKEALSRGNPTIDVNLINRSSYTIGGLYNRTPIYQFLMNRIDERGSLDDKARALDNTTFSSDKSIFNSYLKKWVTEMCEQQDRKNITRTLTRYCGQHELATEFPELFKKALQFLPLTDKELAIAHKGHSYYGDSTKEEDDLHNSVIKRLGDIANVLQHTTKFAVMYPDLFKKAFDQLYQFPDMNKSWLYDILSCEAVTEDILPDIYNKCIDVLISVDGPATGDDYFGHLDYAGRLLKNDHVDVNSEAGHRLFHALVQGNNFSYMCELLGKSKVDTETLGEDLSTALTKAKDNGSMAAKLFRICMFGKGLASAEEAGITDDFLDEQVSIRGGLAQGSGYGRSLSDLDKSLISCLVTGRHVTEDMFPKSFKSLSAAVSKYVEGMGNYDITSNIERPMVSAQFPQALSMFFGKMKDMSEDGKNMLYYSLIQSGAITKDDPEYAKIADSIGTDIGYEYLLSNKKEEPVKQDKLPQPQPEPEEPAKQQEPEKEEEDQEEEYKDENSYADFLAGLNKDESFDANMIIEAAAFAELVDKHVPGAHEVQPLQNPGQVSSGIGAQNKPGLEQYTKENGRNGNGLMENTKMSPASYATASAEEPSSLIQPEFKVSPMENELKMGVNREHEHTDNPAVATEIALDHLAEDKEYYSKLNQVMPESGKEEKKERTVYVGPRDKEVTDFDYEKVGKDVMFPGVK